MLIFNINGEDLADEIKGLLLIIKVRVYEQRV